MSAGASKSNRSSLSNQAESRTVSPEVLALSRVLSRLCDKEISGELTNEEELLWKLFLDSDANLDGRIDPSELSSVFTFLSSSDVDNERIVEIVDELKALSGKLNNGGIMFSDFLKWWNDKAESNADFRNSVTTKILEKKWKSALSYFSGGGKSAFEQRAEAIPVDKLRTAFKVYKDTYAKLREYKLEYQIRDNMKKHLVNLKQDIEKELDSELYIFWVFFGKYDTSVRGQIAAADLRSLFFDLLGVPKTDKIYEEVVFSSKYFSGKREINFVDFARWWTDPRAGQQFMQKAGITSNNKIYTERGKLLVKKTFLEEKILLVSSMSALEIMKTNLETVLKELREWRTGEIIKALDEELKVLESGQQVKPASNTRSGSADAGGSSALSGFTDGIGKYIPKNIELPSFLKFGGKE